MFKVPLFGSGEPMLGSCARKYAAVVITACIYATNAVAEVASVPKVGNIVRDERFWRTGDNWQTGLCPWSDDCVYAAAVTRQNVVIYLAKPIERDQDNGIAAKKIFSVSSFPVHRGEEVANCSGWLSDSFLVFTLLNRRTKTIRDFYAESDGEIRMVAHQYKTDPSCEYDEP